MREIKIVLSLVILLVTTISCSVPDGISNNLTVDSSIVPYDVAALIDITNDNSGKVTITPSAMGAGTYSVYFGDGTANPALVQFGANVTHVYQEGNYTIKVVANGLNGVKTEQTFPLSVVYRAPENLTVTFTKRAHNLKVKANALYAVSYLVYFGDGGAGEVGTPLALNGEVSHDYAAAGTYDVKVIALSGGIAQIEKITPVVIYDPFELPISFESPNVIYSFVTSGNMTFLKTTNPNLSGINTSPTVGRFFKVVGAAANSSSTSTLDLPIDFSTGNKIRVLVYTTASSNIGKKLNVELQSAVGGTPANGVAILKVPLTISGSWEELVFDFSTIPGIPSNAKFNQLVFRFNDTQSGRNEIIYFDNIRLTN